MLICFKIFNIIVIILQLNDFLWNERLLCPIFEIQTRKQYLFKIVLVNFG